jgi:hypothetical protein
MTEEIKKPNTAEDIEKVSMARGLAITNIGIMGNNDSEMNRIENICKDFEDGKLNADKAVEELNVVWSSKQMGAM